MKLLWVAGSQMGGIIPLSRQLKDSVLRDVHFWVLGSSGVGEELEGELSGTCWFPWSQTRFLLPDHSFQRGCRQQSEGSQFWRGTVCDVQMQSHLHLHHSSERTGYRWRVTHGEAHKFMVPTPPVLLQAHTHCWASGAPQQSSSLPSLLFSNPCHSDSKSAKAHTGSSRGLK